MILSVGILFLKFASQQSAIVTAQMDILKCCVCRGSGLLVMPVHFELMLLALEVSGWIPGVLCSWVSRVPCPRTKRALYLAD